MMTNLGRMIIAYQQFNSLENQVMAKEIGISASSLSRIKGGKILDAVGLVKIIKWMVEK